MSVYLGARAAIDLMFEVGGIDAAKVMDFQNRNGLSNQQVINLAGAAIGAVNASIVSRYGGLLYFTTESYARYRNGEGSVGKTPKKAEFSPADGVRGQETGNMLPLYDYEDALSWNKIYLRDAYLSSLQVDLQVVTERWENRVDEDVLKRMFSKAETAWGSGYVVPFAIGTGVSVPYIPPQFRKKTFTSSHTHFEFHTGTAASDYAALLTQMMKNLREHGFEGMLTALVSFDDVEKYTAMTGFQEIKEPQVTIVADSARIETVDGVVPGIPGEVFGYFSVKGYGRVELRSWASVPTEYVSMFRSYGANNVNNPMAVRIHPTVPFGLIPDIRITPSLTPEIDRIALMGTHGVGVNNRLNGVAGQVNASSYTDPTWS